MPRKELTEKQKRFCEYYVAEPIAKEAAIKAGYSQNRASEIAYQLLQKNTVRNEIKRLKEARSERVQLTQDFVLLKLARYVSSNITDYFEFKDNGDFTLKDLSKLPKDVTDCISEIAQTKDGVRLKIIDKKGILEDIARHLGMFNDNLNVQGTLSFEELLLKRKIQSSKPD